MRRRRTIVFCVTVSSAVKFGAASQNREACLATADNDLLSRGSPTSTSGEAPRCVKRLPSESVARSCGLATGTATPARTAAHTTTVRKSGFNELAGTHSYRFGNAIVIFRYIIPPV